MGEHEHHMTYTGDGLGNTICACTCGYKRIVYTSGNTALLCPGAEPQRHGHGIGEQMGESMEQRDPANNEPVYDARLYPFIKWLDERG
jgi:hypothetical protein